MLATQAAGCEALVVIQSLSTCLKDDMEAAFRFLRGDTSDWSFDPFICLFGSCLILREGAFV